MDMHMTIEESDDFVYTNSRLKELGKMQDKRVVLVAGIGTSPAILTETVWTLAHKEQTVPDEIVVITTKTGKQKIKDELLSGANPVWVRLKRALEKECCTTAGKLKFGETSVRVIPDAEGNEITDLRTAEENLGAADFMLRQLRQYTEDPNTVVLTSIAGGRKTMSALMFSCMSLLGRQDDKVYHVLLPSPFEGGVQPPFYFPEKGVVYTAKNGKEYSAADVDGELFEVPYVRMRELYQEKYNENIPDYQTLVARIQSSVCPKIEVDAWKGRVLINDCPVDLAATEFAVLIFLLNRFTRVELLGKLTALHNCKNEKAAMCGWLSDFKEGSRFSVKANAVADLSKSMSTLRGKLMKAKFPGVEKLVPKRKDDVTFPVERVIWKNREKLADVCGNLFPGGQT